MKKILYTLLISFAMGISLIGQTAMQQATTHNHSDQDPHQLVTPTAKSNFIQGQNYLSPSALKDYQESFMGDSLDGFNEKSAKQDLLNNHVSGQEYMNVMAFLKRDYVNQKYYIGSGALNNGARPAAGSNGSSGNGHRPIGGGNTVNSAPCVNEDFEATPVGQYTSGSGITGWSISNLTQSSSSCWAGTYAAGGPEVWVRSTPILSLPGIGTLPNSPLGGTNVVQLNDYQPTGLRQKLVQTFPVTSANTLFQFAFAGVWQDGGHNCCTQPALRISMYDCTGSPLSCSSLSLNASGSGCATGAPGYSASVVSGTAGAVSWTNWQVKYIDLTPYVGSCVTIEIINGDCTATGHFGVLYFDTECGGQVIGNGLTPPPTGTIASIAGPVSYCAGSNQAIIAAPLGYAQYQWIAPTGTVPAYLGGTAPSLTVSNPVPGSVYTVNLVTGSGCHFVSTNTLTTSQVNIQAIGTSSTCSGGGASGSATVVGNGSGTGYTYNWQNSSGTSVGTSSIVTGLAAGVYTVTIGGAGATGCGIASSTLLIGATPTPTSTLLKPYCGNSAAYLAAPLTGANFQWYHNGQAIQTAVGGNASTYTVTTPSNGTTYWLTYHSSQGCNDSIQFILVQSLSGILSVPGPATVCPGSANGTSTISISPAAGSPSGQNAYTVVATGTTPAYSYSASGLSSTVFYPTGFSAGTYSVNGFDGSCKYSTTFTVSTLSYNFSLTPQATTLCSGSLQNVNMAFQVPPLLYQYTYQWSPTTYLNGINSNPTIIHPVVAPGVISTIIYTATATSTLASCAVSHTMAMTVINPAIPHFITVPNVCDNAAPLSVTATPSGGTFFSSNSPLINANGLVTPSQGTLGVNTFSYTYAVNQCSVTVDSSFNLVHYNTSLLTGSLYPSCVNSGTVNLMNLVQNTVSGVWTGPGVSGSNGNYIFDPADPALNASPNTSMYALVYHTYSTPNPTVCPEASTMSVQVTSTLTPTITPVAAFCTNQSAITMTASPTGGNWVGTGVSAAGIITPANMPSGISTVTYNIYMGACVNSNTTSLNVDYYNTTALTGTPPPFCISSSAFDLYSIMQSTYNVTWSGTGVNPGTGFFDPAQAPTTNSVFVLTASAPSIPTNLCPSATTLQVTVYNPTATINSQLGTQCSSSGTMQLMATPATGSWIATQYLTNGGIFNPALAVIGNNQVQYTVGNATCNAIVSQNIDVEAFVSAAISASILPDVCVTGSPVNLSPFAISGSGSWTGTGVNGIGFDPANAGAGNYVLTHHTSSSPSGLCPDQATVAISVYSLQTPVLTAVGPFCSSSLPQQISASPLGGVFSGLNSLAVGLGGLFSPANAVVGDNIINYSITVGPCVSYAQSTITVEGFIPATVIKPLDASYCKNNPNPLNLDQFVQNPGGTWSGTGVSGSMFVFANANVGTTTLHYLTHSATYTLCPDQSEMDIVVVAVPALNISSILPQNSCAPMQATVFPTSTLSGAYFWDLGDGNQSLDETVGHTYTTPGNYTVILTVAGSCTSQAVLPISVSPKPTADFSMPDEVTVSNPEVTVNNLSSNGMYQWKIGNALYSSGSTDMTPTLTFAAVPASYPITLIVTSGGCQSEITKMITVKNEFNVFIPTSFTPNYDSRNDEFLPKFTPYGLDEKSYEMEIFDRWGSSLFKTKDPYKGWDGTIGNKGAESLKEDNYVYRIRYKDMDGNVYSKMGTVTLLK